MTVKPADHISHHLREVIDELTTEQLAHILACRRAVEHAEPLPPLEYETRELTVEEKVFHFAEWARSIGIDDEAAIACDLYGKLSVRLSAEDAAEVLRDVGIVYTPRTAEERLVHVAAEMLAGEWDEEQVRWAIDGLVS
jgi:hypothetical protein